MRIETDYLVVGAGNSGLAFTDTLTSHSPAEVVIVDRNDGPGGHWSHAYPFVQLHQPSWFYGVDSVHLGHDRIESVGSNAGLYERAALPELLAYYARVVAALETTGRVRFLFGHEYVDGVVRSLATGEVIEVAARQRVVDARYLETSVPATHQPSYEIAGDARVVAVGQLPEQLSDGPFVILGSGKTGADTCAWLLDQGVDPDRIRWIRPRDSWHHDRSRFQGIDRVGDTIAGLAEDAEALAEARDLEDLQNRFEDSGSLVRLAPYPALMYRGGILAAAEAELLRQIVDVVRLGHVRRVEAGRIVLSQGEVALEPGSLVVDCTARGLNDAPPRPIWSSDRMVLQQVRHNSPSFNAALIGRVEATGRTDEEKNVLCPPNPFPRSIGDYPRLVTRTWRTEAGWLGHPEIRRWVAGSRLNMLRVAPHQKDDPLVRQAIGRFVDAMGPAITNAERLLPSPRPR